MNCEQLREYYDLYALGLAGQPEGAEIREHLNRGCDACGAGVKRALETAALVGASAPPAQPSARLRQRILASVGSEERRSSGWLLWASAVAALLVIALYLGTTTFTDSQRAVRQTAEIVRLREAFAILSGPNMTEASFGGQQPMPPQGKVFVSPARGVLLVASDLPPTPSDKIYEMWIIRKGAKPMPAGLFRSKADGSAMHVRMGTVDMASTAAVAVTVENAAGADEPTTTPMFVAALSR